MYLHSPSPALCFAQPALLGGHRVGVLQAQDIFEMENVHCPLVSKESPSQQDVLGSEIPEYWQICRDLYATCALVTKDRARSLLPCSPARKLWPWIQGCPAQHPQLSTLHEPIYIYTYIDVYIWTYELNLSLYMIKWGNQGQHVCLCKIREAVTRGPDEYETAICLCSCVFVWC